MWNLEPAIIVRIRRVISRVEDEFIVEENIEIDYSRSISYRLGSPERVFDRFEEREESEWRKGCLDLMQCVSAERLKARLKDKL